MDTDIELNWSRHPSKTMAVSQKSSVARIGGHSLWAAVWPDRLCLEAGEAPSKKASSGGLAG